MDLTPITIDGNSGGYGERGGGRERRGGMRGVVDGMVTEVGNVEGEDEEREGNSSGGCGGGVVIEGRIGVEPLVSEQDMVEIFGRTERVVSENS